jgi:uncharacterized protein Smg (DUF494 family)
LNVINEPSVIAVSKQKPPPAALNEHGFASDLGNVSDDAAARRVGVSSRDSDVAATQLEALLVQAREGSAQRRFVGSRPYSLRLFHIEIRQRIEVAAHEALNFIRVRRGDG